MSSPGTVSPRAQVVGLCVMAPPLPFYKVFLRKVRPLHPFFKACQGPRGGEHFRLSPFWCPAPYPMLVLLLFSLLPPPVRRLPASLHPVTNMRDSVRSAVFLPLVSFWFQLREAPLGPSVILLLVTWGPLAGQEAPKSDPASSCHSCAARIPRPPAHSGGLWH